MSDTVTAFHLVSTKPDQAQLHIDHEEAFSSGGRTKIENLRTSCRECNLGKGASKL